MRCPGRCQLTVLLATLLVIAAPSLAQDASETRLTNADIVKMVRAGIPENIILREIQMSETNFVTTPNSLIELKNQRVPNGILAAMLDSRNGSGRPQAEPVVAPHSGMQSAAARSHHLPSFDAAMRINSTTTGKVSVGENHIKVERSGVPVFSLKWKEKRSQ